MGLELNKVYLGNSLEVIKTFPDESIDCVVTSPPYFGLRDYGTGTWVGGDPNCKHYRESKVSDKTITGHKRMQEHEEPVGDAIYKTVCPICGAVRVDNQIGLEETPEQYIDKLVSLFREIRRCLKKDGTCWVNLGDTYARASNSNRNFINEGGRGGNNPNIGAKMIGNGVKEKDLIGIPWMFAFAMRADGWYLRQDIIWHKPNPMPESVTDRCTKSHEYIFLFSKSQKYFFDYEAIQEDAVGENDKPRVFGAKNQVGTMRNDIGQVYTPKVRTRSQGYSIAGGHRDNSGGFPPRTKNCKYDGQQPNTMHQRREQGLKDEQYVVRNKRDVWSVNVKPNKEAHFATYPQELIVPCIQAGCREDGVVLDPFMGSGTTGIVARKLNRNFVGIELNPEYQQMATRRIFNEGENLFNQ